MDCEYDCTALVGDAFGPMCESPQPMRDDASRDHRLEEVLSLFDERQDGEWW